MAARIRANFGTMGKPMLVARSSENGVTSALLVADGFTFNEEALDGKWGYLEVAGRGRLGKGRRCRVYLAAESVSLENV